MTAEPDFLSPAEAALVAGVSLRDVHRSIDEGILPARLVVRDGMRRIAAEACPMIGFYVFAADALTAAERSRLIHIIADRGGGEGQRDALARPDAWVVTDRFLTVDLSRFAADARERRERLREAMRRVVSDPEILAGLPVLRGTRIPVYDVAASIAAGHDREAVREAWPDLSDRDIDLAVLYAQAVPPRGRPTRKGRRDAPKRATGGVKRVRRVLRQ